VSLDAVVGRFAFARMAAAARAGTPLGAKLFGAIEAAAGTSDGPVPVQSLWYMGGPATLRGYGGAAAVGPSFWRSRAELATACRSAARRVHGCGVGGTAQRLRDQPALVAGRRGRELPRRFDPHRPRARVARPKGWRLEIYSDAIL